jgi:hypothetical protein
MPIKSTTPSRESGVGGVRGEPARRPEGAILPQNASTFAFDAVKGIPIFGKAGLFAGLCRNVDLGRPAGSWWFLHHEVRADDSGCPSDAEEGNDV